MRFLLHLSRVLGMAHRFQFSQTNRGDFYDAPHHEGRNLHPGDKKGGSLSFGGSFFSRTSDDYDRIALFDFTAKHA
jgi:hypothetical protein